MLGSRCATRAIKLLAAAASWISLIDRSRPTTRGMTWSGYTTVSRNGRTANSPGMDCFLSNSSPSDSLAWGVCAITFLHFHCGHPESPTLPKKTLLGHFVEVQLVFYNLTESNLHVGC